MKILIPLFAFVHLSTSYASLIAVMDSGTDINHKALSSKIWVNAKEKKGSTEDLDGDGIPGDINGWDFVNNSSDLIENKYLSLITDDVKKFFKYYSYFEQGIVSQSSAELVWLKEHSQDEVLMNKVNFVGSYIHGTHVAGISAMNNNQSKILTLKILPTEYTEAKPIDVSKDQKDKPIETAAKSIDEFTNEVLESANEQLGQMVALHSYLDFHKVDVVNQSFGVGYKDAVNFITAGFTESLKRAPTPLELNKIVNLYFSKLLKDGPDLFLAAPKTLFVMAAGNDNSNNDALPDYPGNITAENKIVVAATNNYKSLADFSNYGAYKVDLAAPGVAISSTAPGNNYIALSGTSQAAPFVTNIIAAMKDANPSLGAADLKNIVLSTVDIKVWLKGKVRTSGIANRARAIRAAEYSKTLSIGQAIAKARAIVADIATDKSSAYKLTGLKLNYIPARPSLLMKKPINE